MKKEKITKTKDETLDIMKQQIKLSFESMHGIDHLKNTLN